MFEKNYKHAMDGIKPSDDAVSKTLIMMQNESAKKKGLPKNILRIAIVACLSIAIIATSLFAVYKYSGIFNQNEENEFINGIRQAKDYDDIDDVIKDYYRPKDLLALFTNGLTQDDAEQEIVLEDAVDTERVDQTQGSPLYGNADTEDADVVVTDGKEYSDTNNQVSGVQEADFVKTDGEYIYWLSIQSKKLYITEVSQSDMKQTASADIACNNIREMLLLGDTLCIISNGESRNAVTECYYYDISDRSSPTLKHTLRQDGRYISSRSIGSDVFIISSFYKMDNKTADIPEINGEEIAASDIWIPEKLASTEFTVVTSYDANTNNGEFASAISVIGASDKMYCGTENLYLTNTGNGSYIETAIIKTQSVKTNIYRISLTEDKLTVTGTGRVPGNILNQFSMDETGGKLRVATNIRWTEISDDGNVATSSISSIVNRVYCLGDNMEIIGVSGDMGKGEYIKSVRFMGNIAYVVTFRQTDPLYAVDMTDPTNPVILSELKIDGFSTYMHPYDENHLLGIGYEADPKTGIQTGLKLTMFDTADKTDIFDISSCILSWDNSGYSSSEATYNHKAVLVDGKKNIIGIPLYFESYNVSNANGNAEFELGCETYYVFFDFDGTNLSERKKVPLDFDIKFDNIRGLYIDNYSYVVCNSGIICLSLENLEVVSELKFN